MSRGSRYLCTRCDWCWPIHRWLPFDFALATIGYRVHMFRCHRMVRVHDPYGDHYRMERSRREETTQTTEGVSDPVEGRPSF